jgi:hypothetical protein
MNMKKALIGAAFLTAVSLTHSANAQAATGTGTATAKVLAPIAIAAGANLNFGTIASGAVGTVVVTSAGARSATGGVGLVTDGANAPTAGVFTVTGAAGYGFSITLPVGTASITSGANSMTVGTFTSTPSGSGTLVAGTATVNVGGTLNVGLNQAAGAYTGTYPVTVNYN